MTAVSGRGSSAFQCEITVGDNDLRSSKGEIK
jgi:hypothetical protein